MFTLHHFTISVRNVDETARFYGIFGFKLVLRWSASDSSLVIAHLADEDGFILEIFQYRENGGMPRPELGAGNNLPSLGVKHVAFKVANVRATRTELLSIECGELTEIEHGRTGVEYFFVSDPDGNWVEILQDDRSLNSESPALLTGPA
jgi:catechol 2,3-dioxygenase-like lactoylglutathione lyase family enzyme